MAKKNSLRMQLDTPLVDPLKVLSIHEELRRKDASVDKHGLVLRSRSKNPMDVEWLKLASSVYQISKDIKDYLMVPLPTMYAGIPNRNGVGFSLKDLASFSPSQGRPTYQTWKGKPVLYEHSDHDDPTTAKGVVLDASLVQDEGFWKHMAYLAVDRSKDAQLAKDLLSRKLETFSIGCTASRFDCSACGSELGKCSHLDKRKPRNGFGPLKGIVHSGKDPEIVYSVGRNPIGIEISVVGTPAYPMAGNSTIQVWEE